MGLEKPKLNVGMKRAKGEVTSAPTNGNITVSGLAFTPSIIILKMKNSTTNYYDFYSYANNAELNTSYGINAGLKSGTSGSGVGAIVPNATGFTTTTETAYIPPSTIFTWSAYGN